MYYKFVKTEDAISIYSPALLPYIFLIFEIAFRNSPTGGSLFLMPIGIFAGIWIACATKSLMVRAFATLGAAANIFPFVYIIATFPGR